MPLPSSIWVKFTNQDAVLVTYNDPADDAVLVMYLGVQYRLTWSNSFNWYAMLSGDETNGIALSWNDTSSLIGSDTRSINTIDITDGLNNGPIDELGSVSYTDWAVTSFTGTDISAASIVRNPVQYRLTFDENEAAWYIFLSGNFVNGEAIRINAEGFDTTATLDIVHNIYVESSIDSSTVIGTLTYDNWAVTSFTGSAISAASIVHRDVRLPLFVEVPTNSGGEDGYYITTLQPENGFNVTVVLGTINSPQFDINTQNELGDPVLAGIYSLTWDSTTNTGTTNCPFVEFIGELSTTEVFTESGTWTPPANIDATKPVIVEAWGSGDGNNVSDGCGGGAYAGIDISGFSLGVSSITVAVGNSQSYTYVDGTTFTLQANGGIDQGGGQIGDGDVKFSGGDAVTTTGGGSAFPYQNASGATGYGAGGTDGVAGTIPGGGGGAGAAGARGEVRIHYSLLAESSSSSSQITISSDTFYSSYPITAIVPQGSANLGEDWDMQLPTISINSEAVFGTEIKEIGSYSVQYLTIPIITLPATFSFSTIEGTEIRYSFFNRPHSKSTKYIEPFILSNKPGTSSLVKLRFRAFKDTNGVISPLQGSKMIVAQFYIR